MKLRIGKRNILTLVFFIFLINETSAQIGTETSDSLIQKKNSFLNIYKKNNWHYNKDSLKEPGISKYDSIKGNDNMNKPKFKNIDSVNYKVQDKIVLNKDSVKSRLKDKLASKKDSSLTKRNMLTAVKNIFPSGSISAGYDYGFLPYTVNMPSPASAFVTEGQIATNVLNIPLDITYFYSSQKNLIGLNNYFRISYNADRYKDKLNNKLTHNVEGYKNQLGGLTNQRQNLMQKMAYTDYLSSINPDKWPSQEMPKTDSLNLSKPKIDSAGLVNTLSVNNYSRPDSTQYENQYLKKDSLAYGGYLSKADSLKQKEEYYKFKTDSVKQLYDTYSSRYDSVSTAITELQKKVNATEEITNSNYSAYLSKIPYFNKVQNFLSGIKKFEIGLCYPNHSTFLVNNVPVRGINMEYAKKNTFFAFTYGTTVSTLLYNNKNIEGFLQNVRNSYNYFDFSNVDAGRKVLSAKFGAGTKENNHLFVGFLIGKGQSSYLNSTNEGISFRTKESNVVLEADGRFKFKDKATLDVVLAKSSLKQEDLSYDLLQSSVKEIFSKYRSYALLTKLSTKIDITKTNINFSFRWIDPFFKSFGTGFLRSDNLRYEVKLDQPLTKKIKYIALFRYEEDNLLKLMNYKNTFYSINNSVTYRVKRGLTLRASYTPLIRTLKSESFYFKNRNSITTGVITYTPRTRKTALQFNVLYNYYLVNADTQSVNFQNIAYSHQISFKSGFKTGLNVSWFKNNLSDSLNNNVFLGVLDIGYQFKNGSYLSVAGKSAYKLNNKFYPGFIVKCNLKLFKALYWENQVEKFIVGDLFNGYDLENLKKFPYYCSTRLIFKF